MLGHWLVEHMVNETSFLFYFYLGVTQVWF